MVVTDQPQLADHDDRIVDWPLITACIYTVYSDQSSSLLGCPVIVVRQRTVYSVVYQQGVSLLFFRKHFVDWP